MTSSNSEYVFLSSALFASFKGRSLPRHGICKPECTVLLLIVTEATPVGSSKKNSKFSWVATSIQKQLISLHKTQF